MRIDWTQSVFDYVPGWSNGEEYVDQNSNHVSGEEGPSEGREPSSIRSEIEKDLCREKLEQIDRVSQSAEEVEGRDRVCIEPLRPRHAPRSKERHLPSAEVCAMYR